MKYIRTMQHTISKRLASSPRDSYSTTKPNHFPKFRLGRGKVREGRQINTKANDS